MSEKKTDDRIVTLVSKDGNSFELPAEAAKYSNLIKDALFSGDDSDDENEAESNKTLDPLRLDRVNGGALNHIVKFLQHYAEEKMKEIPVPLGGNSFEEVMDQNWYQTFVSEESMPDNMLFEVLTAANFMGIQPLLDLACLKITFDLQGKTAEEIRTTLNLPELTPEEEAQARQEHPWIFEESS